MSRNQLLTAAVVLALAGGAVSALRGEGVGGGPPIPNLASLERSRSAVEADSPGEPGVVQLPAMSLPKTPKPNVRATANTAMSLDDGPSFETVAASLPAPRRTAETPAVGEQARPFLLPTVAVPPNRSFRESDGVVVRSLADGPAFPRLALRAPELPAGSGTPPTSAPEAPYPDDEPVIRPDEGAASDGPDSDDPAELPPLGLDLSSPLKETSPRRPSEQIEQLAPPPIGEPGPKSAAVPGEPPAGELLPPPVAPPPNAGRPPGPSNAFTLQQVAADPHLGKYAGRIGSMPSALAGDVPAQLPAEALWWQRPAASPLWTAFTPVPVNVSNLVLSALDHSPDVLAMRLEPEVLRHAVCEERAVFDWNAFIEGTYDDISDPVGNTLTTGGEPRLEDRVLASTSGLRRRTLDGGEFEVSQRLGYQDNNSQFFLPTQQGSSRLSLSFTQPLMNGRGEAYQRSQVVLAALDTGMAEDDTSRRLQDHLLKVAEAYWDLYRSRCLYLQRRKVLIQAERSLTTLEGRRSIDALPRQILRARAAVTSRRSQIARAAADVRNHEARLRMLVGDTALQAAGGTELVPTEPPQSFYVPVAMADAAAEALMNRADIKRAVKELRGTAVRLGVAEHEMMPRLDLVLNGYLSGLEGEGNIPGSIGDQFTEGRPSFAAGLLFEVPLGRRAATARRHRRQMELVRATHEFEATVETALTEVELAVREVETTYREMLSRHAEMQAASDEADYLEDRWELMPVDNGSASRLLEDLLDAQERLADDEGGLTTAQVNYLLALAHLRRSTGTLLQFTPANRTTQPHVPVPPVAEVDREPSGRIAVTPEAGGVR